MRKSTKKQLVLATETLRRLDDKALQTVAGGAVSPGVTQDCSKYQSCRQVG